MGKFFLLLFVNRLGYTQFENYLFFTIGIPKRMSG